MLRDGRKRAASQPRVELTCNSYRCSTRRYRFRVDL